MWRNFENICQKLTKTLRPYGNQYMELTMSHFFEENNVSTIVLRPV